MYIYEGHLGSLYTSSYELDYDELYCEECGDSDYLIGCAETKEEAWELLKDITDTNGSGGWDYDYVQSFINKNWKEQEMNPIDEMLMKIAIAIEEKCGSGGCPIKKGCEVYSDEDCINNIVDWLKSVIDTTKE